MPTQNPEIPKTLHLHTFSKSSLELLPVFFVAWNRNPAETVQKNLFRLFFSLGGLLLKGGISSSDKVFSFDSKAIFLFLAVSGRRKLRERPSTW